MSADISISGFIKLTLVDAITGAIKEQQEYHNVVTPIGKQLILDRAIAALLQTGSDTYGRTHMSHAMFKDYYLLNITDYAYAGVHQNSSTCLSNALLGLPSADLAALTSDTSYAHVYNDTMSANDYMIGLASSAVDYNTASSPANKEGVLDYAEAEYIASPYKNAKHWRYDAGIASGSINAIAMMPASCARQKDGPGLRFEKLLDKCIGQNSNFVKYTTAFCPPGITGVTANNEVLLNFNQGGTSKWRYNITTGAMTAVADSEVFWVPIARIVDSSTGNEIDNANSYWYINPSDYYIEGDYLYICGGTTPDTDYAKYWGTEYFSRFFVIVMRISTRSFIVNKYLARSGIKGGKFLKIPGDTNLYVTHMTYNVSLMDLTILSKSAGLYYDTMSINTKVAGLPALVAALPSGVTSYGVMIGNYGSNFTLYVEQVVLSPDMATTLYQSFGKLNAYVFTDIADIGGSVVDCIYNLDYVSYLFSTDSASGTLSLVRFRHDEGPTATSGSNYTSGYIGEIGPYNRSSGRVNVVNKTGTLYGVLGYYGLYLSLDKWWGNMVSYKKLDTPITKTANDVLYVTYGYEVGAGT